MEKFLQLLLVGKLLYVDNLVLVVDPMELVLVVKRLYVVVEVVGVIWSAEVVEFVVSQL